MNPIHLRTVIAATAALVVFLMMMALLNSGWFWMHSANGGRQTWLLNKFTGDLYICQYDGCELVRNEQPAPAGG
jgi:hypothetical protein